MASMVTLALEGPQFVRVFSQRPPDVNPVSLFFTGYLALSTFNVLLSQKKTMQSAKGLSGRTS